MKRAGRNLVLLAAAGLAGLAASELLYRSTACREATARFSGRGELQAIVHGVGLYEAEDLDALIIEENLRHASQGEFVSDVEIERELNLIVSQFGDEKSFTKTLESSGLPNDLLRRRVAKHLRERTWIETQIVSSLSVTEAECREFFGANREQFVSPQRFRASHVFLAAHDGTPEHQVEGKRKAIQALAGRISKGESLADVATEASEDEATQKQGGDLGIFSASRVPADFIAQVGRLRIGQVTSAFPTPLGFHIAELTDLKPPRDLSFEEVRAEIAGTLANQKRAAAVATLAERLNATEFRRPKP